MKAWILLLALPVQAAAQSPPIDLAYARAYFEEAKQLGAADAGRLWGRPVAGPLLFADRATRAIVANMADREGKLTERDGVWVGVLPPDQNLANAALNWAGRRWAMIVWPVSDNKYARGRLLMHESYHRIQDELGLEVVDGGNAHLATASARIWTRLEWRALTEALLRTGAERTQALRDALTFRARRRMDFKDAAEDERRLELNEGLAEYTGLKLSGLPENVLADRVALQLAQYEQQDNFARSFAYASGPAYALLLDAAGKPWRAGLTPASDLSALAAGAFGVESAAAAAAESLVTRYAGERMMADERAREAQRLAVEARLRARLIDGPTLTLPVLAEFKYTFDPNGAIPLAGTGTAFESSRISDSWGVLEVTNGGVLLRRSEAGLITGVIVSAPVGETRRGDGWELVLKPGWTVTPGERAGDVTVVRE